ncbi:MAG: hypothetical protein E7313_00100 [Clostridiales bacterium]|nr:hypothetical protein [Clostridiales bacterium]
MGVSINTRQAYSEIDEFLGLLSSEQRNKVPQKLRELFIQEKDNPDNIFKKRASIIDNEEEKVKITQIIKYKETVLKRVLNKILKFLHLK